MNTNEKKYVEKTLRSYEEKKPTKLDELRALDSKAKRGANIFAYVFGTIGSLILGSGMCVAMGVILEEYMILGIVVGLVGIAMVSLNYFIYKKLLEAGKKKYANQIKSLSSELLNE